jgi:hypothetical protein
MKGLFSVSRTRAGGDFGVGRFAARLESFELLRGAGGPIVRWWFAVEVPGETVRLPWDTGTAVAAGSRLAILLQAVRQPLPTDDGAAAEIDAATFLGAPCYVHLDRRYEEEGSRQVVSCIASVSPPDAGD